LRKKNRKSQNMDARGVKGAADSYRGEGENGGRKYTISTSFKNPNRM